MMNYDDVNRILHEKFKFTKGIAASAHEMFGDSWMSDFEESVSILFPDEQALESAIKGYSGFALDFMRRQKRFEKERKYQHSSYSKAVEEVYSNQEYMMEQYLPGLLLSHYFWNHHYKQLQFFERFFIEPIEAGRELRFCEVGIGTGLYSRRSLQLLPKSTGLGFDISESSKLFSGDHIDKFGFSSRYDIALQDITTLVEPEQFDLLICVEVLEHLEDPLSFLAKLRELLKLGSKAFITAALNSPDKDHIYLYSSPDEVLHQLESVGFTLEQSFHASAFKPVKPGFPYPSVASFIVS